MNDHTDMALAYLREKIANLNGRLYLTGTGNYAIALGGLRYYLTPKQMAYALACLPSYLASAMKNERRRVA